MTGYFEGEGAAPIRFFHICTDGTHNGIVHFDDVDYIQATNIMAITAFKEGVGVLCYCHMSTHSHFVVYCETFEQAENFGEEFKRNYSRHVALRHGERKVYHGVDSTPKEIHDPFYLKNCISYSLLNPVAARLVKRPEDYHWSSFEAYFNNAPEDGKDISECSIRYVRDHLRTRLDIRNSDFRIDKDGYLTLRSVVNYRFVERLFRSRTDFFRSLAITSSNYASEEERYVTGNFHYSDTELMAECLNSARNLYEKDSLQLLTKPEKIKVIRLVQRKTKASDKQLARLLRLSRAEIVLNGKNVRY